MSRRILISVLTGAALLALGLPAGAANFTPKTTFSLSTYTRNANPEAMFHLEQDAGEEELKSVKIFFDHGFRFAGDKAINDEEMLGSGQITIDSGLGCAGGVGTVPTIVPVNLVERDRTQNEKNKGIDVVWVVDLRPVTTIDLKIKGSVANGWTASGKIPPNDLTCPPFAFDLTVDQTSATSMTKIIRNPKEPGRYLYRATYTGVDGSTARYRKTLHITS